MISPYAERNVNKLSEITGKYNGVGHGKMLMILNEANDTNSKSDKDMDALKSVITDEEGRMEMKYMNKTTVDRTANLIVVTNNTAPVSVTPHDRRYLIALVSAKFKEVSAFFDPLVAMMQSEEFYSELLTYFLSLDISNFDPRVIPWTPEKTGLILTTMPAIDRFCYKFIELLTRPEGMSCDDARAEVEMRWKKDFNSARLFELAMSDRCERKQIRVNSRQVWTYILKHEYAICLQRLH